MYLKYEKSNREEYYEQFIFPKNILQLYQWQTDLVLSDALKSEIHITFQNIEFGMPKKKILNSIGTPKFIIRKEIISNKSYEILFYKKILDNNKLIFQLHCLSDLFICGCYTFRYISRNQFPYIKNLLLEKYSKKNTIQQTRNSNILLDAEYNQIRFVDDVNLNLVYISGGDQLKKLIEEYAKENEVNKQINRQISFKELYGAL